MKREKDLIKNTLVIFLGKFCTQFLSFFLVPLYTRYLITSDYGYVDLLQTYITLLVPIIILRSDTSVFRYLIDARKNNDEKSKIISNILFLIIIQILLCSVIYLFISFLIRIKYGFYLYLCILLMSFSSVFLQICRGFGRNIDYSIASIISGVVSLLLNIYFIIFMHGTAEFILISSILGNFACCFYLLIKLNLFKYFSFSALGKNEVFKYVRYSVPMIPDGLSWWIMNVSDRTIISILLGASINGIYAISCKFSNILSSLYQIFNITWQESASLHINDSDKDSFFNNILNNSINIFTGLCYLLLALMPLVFDIFIGKDYLISYIYIPILLISNIFNAIANIFGGVYIAKKDTKSLAKTTFIAAFINLLFNLLLIKFIGLWSACVSTLISYIFVAVYRYYDTLKYINYKINYFYVIFNFFVLLYFTMMYYISFNIYIVFFNISFSLILFIIINNKIFLECFKHLINKWR